MNKQSKTPPQTWFQNEISTGLQRLLAQGLRSQPPSETIVATEENWVDALWPGSDWYEQRDTPRIREAFRKLIGVSSEWPQPVQFRQHLPKVEPVEKQLPRPSNDDVRLREMNRIADIINLVDVRKGRAS